MPASEPWSVWEREEILEDRESLTRAPQVKELLCHKWTVNVKARGCDQGPARRPWGLSRVQGRGGVWSPVCREGVTAYGEEGSHWGLGRGGCWAGGFEGKGGGCQEGRELSVFIFEMTLFAGGAGCLKF